MDLRGVGIPYNLTQQFIEENIFRGFGDKTAIYYQDEEITYHMLKDKVHQTANMLQEIGVKMEERILISCHDTPEFIYSFLGAVKMGAVSIPVNTKMQPSDYEYYLNDSRAKVFIVHDDIWGKIAHLRSRFIFLEHVVIIYENATEEFNNTINFKRSIITQSVEFTSPYTTEDDAAFWLYSSGSTGNPKGVIHLQHDIEFAVRTYSKTVLQTTSEDRFLSASKLYFAYGLGGGLYFPLAEGGSTVLIKEPSSAEAMFKAIEKYRPTIFLGVPTLYGAMLDHVQKSGKQYDLSSLRLCTSAGEALPSSFIKKWKELFQVDILDGIGSTEALHIFISNRIGDIKEGSTGKIVQGYEAKVVNEQGIPLPPNEIGDLIICGDSIAHGYWNLHEQNKQKFIGRWLHTGDKYYIDEEGYFWYCGRTDDMLKVGGIWVSPVEIENCLLEHEAVLEAAVVGEKTENNLVVPKAYIVLKEQWKASKKLETSIQEFVKQQLARYKYPRIIQFIDELPKTTTGKIQRYKLRELIQDGTIKL
ncbi:4-hydroxybenzoate--CoA ligase [Bacillus sp. FJAT-27231]|uniref:benzoate-CoA ligase family protein n=1 Tax=Bacillus sp. FJAT-27231 TaxID=1679168 RepID=UPI000670AC27|nr:benzoate-CoA ligase family protein [Bacillus sp. FJAT-27231]KMY52719.1 4-hydroxybenzoate--CoA ligase [Bacillus sp. FJAT-27231]